MEARPGDSASPVGRRDRLLLAAGIAGPALFVVSFVVQGALRPGYDGLRHPISALALGGGVAWIQAATFVGCGLLITAYAYGLARVGLGRLVSVLVALVGAGLIGAGIFACDPISGYPPGSVGPAPPTLHGNLHDLFSTPVFLALPIACLVVARRAARGRARGWALYSIVSAFAMWSCFVLAALGFNQLAPWVSTAGLWQRFSIVAGFGWLIALAGALLGSPMRSGVRTALAAPSETSVEAPRVR